MSRPAREPTYHATENLRVRGSGPVNLRVAWKRGDRFEIPNESPVPGHDEARYDARSDVVIFRREQTLTTCYGLRPEYVTNIHGVAVAAAVDEQFGTSYRSGIDAATIEEIN